MAEMRERGYLGSGGSHRRRAGSCHSAAPSPRAGSCTAPCPAHRSRAGIPPGSTGRLQERGESCWRAIQGFPATASFVCLTFTKIGQTWIIDKILILCFWFKTAPSFRKNNRSLNVYHSHSHTFMCISEALCVFQRQGRVLVEEKGCDLIPQKSVASDVSDPTKSQKFQSSIWPSGSVLWMLGVGSRVRTGQWLHSFCRTCCS